MATEVVTPRTARYSFAEMERAYEDGTHDLAEKIKHLIEQSDYSVSLDALVAFVDEEMEVN